MAKATKLMHVYHDEPVTSRARASIEATVPVFSYSGRLRAGLSGQWAVTEPMELTYGWCYSNTVGTGTAGFVIIKYAPLLPEGEPLKSFLLAATAKSVRFPMYRYLQPAIVTPGETIAIVSLTASGHEEIAIQLHGNKIR